MKTIFETARLKVRTYTEQDKINFFLLNGDPEVVRYIRPAKTREECDLFLKEVMEDAEKNSLYGRWAVQEKSTEVFVGSFALIPVENTSFMQLGYSLLPAYWGLGYATELTKKGLEYVFTSCPLDIVYGYTEKPNTASQQVLLKTGFRYAGEKTDGGKVLSEFVMDRNRYQELTSTSHAAVRAMKVPGHEADAHGAV